MTPPRKPGFPDDLVYVKYAASCFGCAPRELFRACVEAGEPVYSSRTGVWSPGASVRGTARRDVCVSFSGALVAVLGHVPYRPTWTPPEMDARARGRIDDHPDEDDPLFEDVVRLYEDCL